MNGHAEVADGGTGASSLSSCHHQVEHRLCAGWTARQVFSQGVTYTYDDVIFHPGFIDFGADEVRQAACSTCPSAAAGLLQSPTSRAGSARTGPVGLTCHQEDQAGQPPGQLSYGHSHRG